MRKFEKLIFVFGLLCVFATGLFAQNQSVVYFTRDVSSAGLMKVYRALNQKIEGNVGIKVSFGGPDEEVLQPELLRDLVKTTGGTMFDGNGLSGNRRTSEMNLSYARQHGFAEIGKCVMLSDNDYIVERRKSFEICAHRRRIRQF